jgi:hypothetical protein
MLQRSAEEGKYEVIDYFASEDTSILKTRITLFDDVHTRGAERSSMAGVTEYVTLDVNTTWSRFEQAALRERNVTKGKAHVRYIMTPELKKELGDDCSLNKLIQLLNKNEAKELQELNYKAERQKVKFILKQYGEAALRSISRETRAAGGKQHELVRELVYNEVSRLYVISNKIDVLQAGAPQADKKTTEVLDDLVSE